jgi:hypothetical protein
VLLWCFDFITTKEHLSICCGFKPRVKRISIDGDPSIYLWVKILMHFFSKKNQGSKRGVLGSKFDLTVLSQFSN